MGSIDRPDVRRPEKVTPLPVTVEEFEAARPRLLSAAHRMLGSAQDAQDAVQTAWLRAVTAPASPPVDNPSPRWRSARPAGGSHASRCARPAPMAVSPRRGVTGSGRGGGGGPKPPPRPSWRRRAWPGCWRRGRSRSSVR
ncbi:sigma factor [Streptomyces cyaneofuscatus]